MHNITGARSAVQLDGEKRDENFGERTKGRSFPPRHPQPLS